MGTINIQNSEDYCSCTVSIDILCNIVTICWLYHLRNFRLTEYAEWILEQRNGYKIFTRKLEGICLLILKWECKDSVKIDFTESSLNIRTVLD